MIRHADTSSTTVASTAPASSQVSGYSSARGSSLTGRVCSTISFPNRRISKKTSWLQQEALSNEPNETTYHLTIEN